MTMNGYDTDETIECPVCGEPFSNESWCEHLAISADDADVLNQSVEFADAIELWRALRQVLSANDVGSCNAFVEAFVESCPAAARVDTQVWDGGWPGLSGVWFFVWTADPERLKEEIRDALLEELHRIGHAKKVEK
jgi:hypothetical protein